MVELMRAHHDRLHRATAAWRDAGDTRGNAQGFADSEVDTEEQQMEPRHQKYIPLDHQSPTVFGLPAECSESRLTQEYGA